MPNICRSVVRPTCRAVVGRPSSTIIDTAAKTVALLGDSITAQNTSANEQEHLSQGWLTWYNAITGQRLPLDPAYNLGVGGYSVAQVKAAMTGLASLTPTPDLVFVMAGANDVVAATTEASMKADLQDIYDYCVNTIGAEVIALTIPPRTQYSASDAGINGAALSTADETKRSNVNDWILNTASNVKVAINLDPALVSTGTTPDSTKFDGEGIDGDAYVHPNPRGALAMAQAIKTALDNVYGSYDIPDMSVCALGMNSDLSGTGGTESSALTSATIADGWNLSSYSGMTGTATKDANDKQEINISYSTLRTFNIYELQATDITLGFSVGEKYYMECEVEIIETDKNRSGACVEPTLNSSGSFKGMTPYDSPDWPESFSGTLHLRTPTFTIGVMDISIDPILWMQMNDTAGAGKNHVIWKQARFVEVV